MNPLRPSAVLVVEDDPDHARIAQIVLMALVPGIPIEICGVRAEAARALDDLPHGTLVLMDRVLHGVEAFDAIVELRVRRPDVAIVMLSALLSSVDRTYAIACGALDAIEKPSTLAAWRSTLGALVVAADDALVRRPPLAA